MSALPAETHSFQVPRWLLCAHYSETQKIWLSRSDTFDSVSTLRALSSHFRFQELTPILKPDEKHAFRVY